MRCFPFMFGVSIPCLNLAGHSLSRSELSWWYQCARDLPYNIVNYISCIACPFGSVTTFRAYLDIFTVTQVRGPPFRAPVTSDISMIDCPYNGKKDAMDKMILGVYATCYSFPRR
jgi:hypothetical protein